MSVRTFFFGLVGALILVACQTTPETPEEALARQAYFNVRPNSYGRLQPQEGDRFCQHSQALTDTSRGPGRSRRQDRDADQNILNEQMQHHFRSLTGSTMHNGFMSGGAVVALIERTERRVVFWRVVTAVSFEEVSNAAAQYCQTRSKTSQFAGQSFACTQVYQPIRGQIIEGQDIDVRMQQTYAITSFTCS